MSNSDSRWTWGDRPATDPAGASSTATPGGSSWPTPGGSIGDSDDDLLRQRVEAALGTQYVLGPELGRGGMAVVYKATERGRGRLVALKVLRGDMLRDPELRARFEREAALTMELRHRHVIQTYALHPVSSRGLALALEYVDGGTLKARVRRDGPLPVADVQRIMAEVADALSCAHARGIVHRDIKPENVLLDAATGATKLGDFGIARAAGADTLTMTGSIMGTPAYMSPEQIDGGHVDARSDVYSLGLLAWELLTGRQPWAGLSLVSIAKKQVTEQLPSVSAFRTDVSPLLLTVLHRCLEKSATARFRDAAELLSALQESSTTHGRGASFGVGTAVNRRPDPGLQPMDPRFPVREAPHATPARPRETPSSAAPVSGRAPFSNSGMLLFGAGFVGVAIWIIAAITGDPVRAVKSEAPAADSAPAPRVVAPLRSGTLSDDATSMSPAMTGVIEVNINTSANVFVRDASTGATMMQGQGSSVRLEPPVGEYEVLVEHEFAGPVAQRVVLDASAPNVSLAVSLPLEGSLAVSAASAGATVEMDDKGALGEAPLRLTGIPVGRHTLRYRWPNGTTTSQLVIVRGGEETRVAPVREMMPDTTKH